MFKKIRDQRWKIYRDICEFFRLEIKRLEKNQKMMFRWKGREGVHIYQALKEAIVNIEEFTRVLERWNKETNTLPKEYSDEVIKMKG